MGFIGQCERKHNYFVHVLIRLQVQQVYACIIELCLIIFARNILLMHEMCDGCVCMHAYTHLPFKELICILPEGIGNAKGAISPFKLSLNRGALLAISFIFSSHAMETTEAFNHLKTECTTHISPVVYPCSRGQFM